uniref:Uncharacterized protein n=1 Tax=Globodera pallida TaxID=36090 RepID=A0A183CE10_GLOPA
MATAGPKVRAMALEMPSATDTDFMMITAFDKWARRFRDYICVIGRSFGEQEKLDRLRLALDEIPRDLFDQLTAAETASVEEALKALRSKLDSPQRKELAKRSLALCKQREDESVGVFLKRLAPLVEVANSSLDPDQYKERLSEEFLNRLRPDLAFLIRLADKHLSESVNQLSAQPAEFPSIPGAKAGTTPGNDERQRTPMESYLQGADAPPAQPSSSVMVDANELLRAFSAMKFPAAGTKHGNEPAPMNSISPVGKKESDGEAKEEETQCPEDSINNEQYPPFQPARNDENQSAAPTRTTVNKSIEEVEWLDDGTPNNGRDINRQSPAWRPRSTERTERQNAPASASPPMEKPRNDRAANELKQFSVQPQRQVRKQRTTWRKEREGVRN